MPASERQLARIDGARLKPIVEQFRSVRVTIVGDVMLDHFIFGRVNRISPEAPVPVIEFDREEHRAGGAANVALNAAALGATVSIVGLIGRDEHGAKIKSALMDHGVDVDGLVVDDGRPTTCKTRIVTSRHQQVARIDREQDHEAKGPIEAALLQAIDRASASAEVIVVSDYLKGVISRRVAEAAIAAGQARNVRVLIDPKIAHLDYYAGASVITPNNAEAETAAHMRIRSDADADAAARIIRDRARIPAVLITRGDAGMCLLDGDAQGALPAAAREIADVTGAGDTVIATLALAVARGASLAEAAQLANAAAGITVTKFGPAVVTSSELLASLTV